MSNMICMNYDHNKKFGLLQFHSGYGKFYFNSPKGYNRKKINAQTWYWAEDSHIGIRPAALAQYDCLKPNIKANINTVNK